MTNRLIAVIIIFPIWLALVLVFRRHRQWLLYYMVAAFGATIQLVFLAEHFGFDQILVNIASYHVSLISKNIFHMPIELLTNGRFQILTINGASILKLGIECSAVLESSVLFSLILFYPLFNPSQKALRIIFGLIITYVINIARLLIIVLMAYKFGSEYIFVAHAGVARVFFFICELLLYWYLMTKPTVNTVRNSISKNISIAESAKIGQALKLRHAIIQSVVIFVFIGLSTTSFMVTNEWQKAFKNVPKNNRSIIYKDETTLVPVSEFSGALYQEIALNLSGNEKDVYKYEIQKEDELYVRVLEGQEDLAARVLINDKNTELVTLPSWLFNKEKSIFNPIRVKAGDNVEFRFQNLSKESSQYLVKIFPKDMENLKICGLEPVAKEIVSKPVLPSPTPTPKPGPKAESVLGQKTCDFGLNENIILNLKAGEKKVIKYNIKKQEKINIQVVDGQQDLSARVIVDGDEVGMVAFAPWRFKIYTSLFKPIKVRSGDVLELRFQNISEKQAQYSIKVYPSEDKNVQ